MTRLIKTYLFIAASAWLLSACNKIEEVGEGDNAVYISEASEGNTLQVAYAPGTSTKAYTITPRSVYKTAQNIAVTVAVDASLIQQYNAQHGTSYVEVPAANYTISAGNTVITGGGNGLSEPITVTFNKTDTLSRARKYLLPVTIKSVTGGLNTIGSSSTQFYLVDNSVLISTAPSLKGNYFTPAFTGANASKMNNLTAFTFEALLNVNAFKSPTVEAGISSVMGVEGYTLIRFGDAGLNPGQLQFATDKGNITTPLPLSANAWHHIAVTYDGTTARIYVDGTLALSSTMALGTRSFSAREFYIGRSYNDARDLDGMISEVRIWNVARTQAQLTEGDNKYTMDPTTAGLVAYWKFNEGAGNAAADYTGNGFNATGKNSVTWNAVKLP